MSTLDLENPDPSPGDALRDEAANLLTPRYGRPQREYRAMGKKVDLFFTRNDLGKPVRIYVEAKDYSRNLSRAEAVHIWADYQGIIEANRPATLLLVTREGLSADAQSYILDERPEMRHQTIWELENEALGLTEYVRHQRELFDQDGLSSYYVEGKARRANYGTNDTRELAEQAVELFGEIESWIASDETRPIAILGGYGAGKSSLARRLVAAQAERALRDPIARRPVLIPLGNLARFSTVEGLLGGMFSSDFPVQQGFQGRSFFELNRKGRMLIVLDGFDEMKHAMSWSDFRSQVHDLNRLTDGQAKVVLLGRPSAFTSTDEHFHVLRGVKRFGEGWRRLPDWPEFIEYDLDEFTAAERSQFFRGYLGYLVSRSPALGLDQAWIDARVDEVEKIAAIEPELFGKPVHAKILTDLASDPAVDLSRFAEGMTRWGLYQIFFSSLAEREADKEVRRPINEGQRITFLSEIAFWLWTKKGGATSFSASDIPDDLFEALAPGDSADLDSLKREYLTGSFLEKKSGDIYYFGHRSFAEFLVAERMVRHQPSEADQPVYSRLVRDGVLEFLRDAPDPDVYRGWLDTIDRPRGPLQLEYFAFLADRLGGADALRAELPSTSIWLQLLEIFGDHIELREVLTPKIVAAMRTDDNLLFFLLLSLLQIQASLSRMPKPECAKLIAGALIERLMSRAVYDETSRKAVVEPATDDARMLAHGVVAELANLHFDRAFSFRGKRLLDEKERRLRLADTDIGVHDSIQLLDLAEEFQLPYSDVLACLDVETRRFAQIYFGHAKDFRDIFTRQVKPASRKIAVPRN
ncbi:NACHT domain-containing protein [Sphingopyxis sp. 22461]|uniref:NACHT domain-containing protein n=1 Tax=Sphingopyxis sp. 22461 TaxID=3453923 RepID=UPI003F87D02A